MIPMKIVHGDDWEMSTGRGVLFFWFDWPEKVALNKSERTSICRYRETQVKQTIFQLFYKENDILVKLST